MSRASRVDFASREALFGSPYVPLPITRSHRVPPRGEGGVDD